jgi:hypothetical protein
LSQSVLLEEVGLPKLNTFIITVVFVLVISFLTWSMNMELDEVIVNEGYFVQSEDSVLLDINAHIPLSDIAAISIGDDVKVNIPTSIDNLSIRGNIVNIEKIPRLDEKNNIYYVAKININNESVRQNNDFLIPGMVANLEIKIGSRSLFDYLLGSIYKVPEKAFK